MAVKQVRKAFSKALRERGFSVLEDEAVSADRHIKIVFEGSTWSSFVDGGYNGGYPMEAGSMDHLKKLLSLQGLKLPDRR